MFVSIIIPNYNKIEYLAACLDSCLNQGEDIINEIIVIDDHSTDGSWDLLQRYQAVHSCIKVFKNPKKGAQSARNYGLTKASGKYINWMDSDDLLSANKIKSQIEILANQSVRTLAFCGIIYFKDKIQDTIPLANKAWRNYERPIDFLIEAWLSKDSMILNRWLIPKEIAKELRWDESLQKTQDGLYCYQMVLAASALVFSKEGLVYYRIPQANNNNISNRISKAAAESEFSVYRQYEKILEIEDSKRVRNALYTKYMTFLYFHANRYSDLALKAKNRIKELGFNKLVYKTGNFGKVVSFLGFDNALRLRRLLKGF